VVKLFDPPTVSYYADLLNISYLPILHSINLVIYAAPNAPANTTTPTLNNTAPNPTTPPASQFPQSTATTIPTNQPSASTSAPQGTGSEPLPPIVPIVVGVAIAVAVGYLVYNNATNNRKMNRGRR
jgi:hypothetical protein